ncbi:bifunctional 4-hydroxy-2-oxoglutarate aldolase/2-dehydro-3-deoxy-phosphogluconate aldolase [Anaerosolibacter sp.]|uniref:bifunctional 4-hydroxy-2-oxoglutarate aldolase/2-dehydro-3-deoxy-phosphogluconate aldolase n=1 Tax=Anaerosolibacter sp. TaxID=1872527 RepID=UPI0039F00DE3
MGKHHKLKRLEHEGIVAILRGIEEKEAINIARALYEGGIRCLEVTFNTPGAKEMIYRMKAAFGDDLLVGGGTVLDDVTAKEAIEAGAEFILSPSLHHEVIEVCNQHGVISVPGVYTPTEMVHGYKWGADIVKIFPADILGPKYIQQVRGPLEDIPIMAVGGISLQNAAAFIGAGAMSIGVGSTLINKKYIEEKRYDKITELASAFTAIVKTAKEK